MHARSRTIFFVVGAALALASCASCGDDGPEPTSASEPGTSRARATQPRTATIEGVVRLAPGAELPGYAVNPMVGSERQPELPEECTPPQQSDRHPVRLVRGDRLAGMLVALSEFDAEISHEPVTHEIFIRDCRLTPRIIVATLGDRLRIVNETNYPFLPELGSGLLASVLRGNSREVELARAGMRSLQCGFTASCGRAEIVTMYHPLHTVTDEDGRFRIEGVPVNDELRVNTWHRLFQEAGQTLTLSPGETRQVELVVTPAPPEEPPPATPRFEGLPEEQPGILY